MVLSQLAQSDKGSDMPRVSRWLPAGCLVLLGCGVALAQVQAAPPPEPPTLSVRGHAEVLVPPDEVVVRLGAVIQQADADIAQMDVNKIMQRAIKAIAPLGIPDKQIQTVGITLTPVYSTTPPPGVVPPPPEPHIVGYRASNAIQIRLDDVHLLGKVIDVAVAAGANQVQDVTFRLKDDTQYRQEALAAAARKAQAKAQTIADALGVELAGIRQVQEAGVQTVQPTAYGRPLMATAAAAPTPVQPGEVRVDATVQVTYQLSGTPATRYGGTRGESGLRAPATAKAGE